MLHDYRKNLGRIIKQQRIMVPLTLHKLAAKSGVSPSHIGRVERGDRYPSAQILQKIAKPLGFEEKELLILAGYLSPEPSMMGEEEPTYTTKGLDPYVAKILSQEPVEVQRAVIGILTILKNIALSMEKEQASRQDKKSS